MMDEQQYQEQQQQEQQMGMGAYASPMNAYGGSILVLTNPEPEVLKMEQSFRNIIIDANGNPKQVGDPLMNEIGISSVIGQSQSMINQNSVMSFLDKQEIPKLMGFMADTLIKDLMHNTVRYDIKNKNDRNKILFESLTTSHICLKRALEKNEKNFWRGSQHEVTHRQEFQQQGGRSLLNPLSWGKK